MYLSWMKRLLDLIASSFLLLLLLPLLLAIAILVRLFLGSPILFRQPRPGKNEKIFCLYKFRTMRNQYDGSGKLLSDKHRLSRFGRLLRASSLDELPALFNVLKGEMSLVGPRPLLTDYLPYYTTSEQKRHHVRPGITGWAQVNGRNNISWQKKFELDIWYVENCSLSLDIKIIFLTLIKIIKREGISAKGEATMTRFDLERMEQSKRRN